MSMITGNKIVYVWLINIWESLLPWCTDKYKASRKLNNNWQLLKKVIQLWNNKFYNLDKWFKIL